jgi:O-antigen ligase
VTALARETASQMLWRRLRSPAAWSETVDLFAILTAASLPWSTSLAGIFNALMLLCMVPFLDVRAFVQSLKRPICVAPIALVLLALVGTLWSDAAWGARFYAVNPTVKLLVLPVLLYHFERSRRGQWVFIAFLVSCGLLSVMSWLVVFYPSLALKTDPMERGIFVKNYIDQSQEFTLCAVALAYPIVMLLRQKRYWFAGLLAALALSFFVNMAFVVVSRTALVTVPIMVGVFALLHLKGRGIAIIPAILLASAVLAWQASPQLRKTADRFADEYTRYVEKGEPTSAGLRLEFWRKSLGFFVEAPIVVPGFRRGDRQSAQPDAERRRAMGCHRRRRPLRDLDPPSSPVSWRRACQLGRPSRRRAEYLHLAVQLPSVRLPRGLDVRHRRRGRRRHGDPGSTASRKCRRSWFLNGPGGWQVLSR